MTRHIKTLHQRLVSVAIALCFIAFNKTDGASVAVDSKEPKSETGSNPISNNGGFVEEKLDPRNIGGNEYSGNSYGGYGVTSKPSSNYIPIYSGFAYSGTGNYGSGFTSAYAMSSTNYGTGTTAYNSENSYGFAYGAVAHGPYNTAYGSGSNGVGSSYTRPSCGSSSYGVTPSYGNNPTAGYASGSSYNIPGNGVPSSYGNNVGFSNGNYVVSPHSAYGNNMNLYGSSYGNGYSGSSYGSGSYGVNGGLYGGIGHGVTSSPYSSYAGKMDSSSLYGGNYGGASYGNYGGMANGAYGMGKGANSYSSMNSAYNRNLLGYRNNVVY